MKYTKYARLLCMQIMSVCAIICVLSALKNEDCVGEYVFTLAVADGCLCTNQTVYLYQLDSKLPLMTLCLPRTYVKGHMMTVNIKDGRAVHVFNGDYLIAMDAT